MKQAPPEAKVLAVQTIGWMEAQYAKRVNEIGQTIDLALWLPEFGPPAGSDRPIVRPLRAGEVVIVLADVGAGKTAILQNILASQYPNVTMLFEMELPADLCYERFAALNNDLDSFTVEKYYQGGEAMKCSLKGLEHIYTIAEPRVTLADVEATVQAAKAGKIECMTGKPIAVALDYLGLIHGDKAGSRYEFTTEVANNLKPLAKALDVVLFVTCQVHRKKDDASVEVTLHSARDSGQIEACGDLILGVWRDPDFREHMFIRVVKGRKDGDGQTVNAKFNGRTMQITPWIIAETPRDFDAYAGDPI